MTKSLKIALFALAFAASNAFAAYGDHASIRWQTAGQPAPASIGATASAGAPSMEDFFRWADLGALIGVGN